MNPKSSALRSGEKIRSYFLWSYILINTIATFQIILSNESIGDAANAPYYDINRILVAASIIIALYYIILFPIFKSFDQIPIKQFFKENTGNNEVVGFRLGVVLAFLQIMFLVFCLANGVAIAGAGNKKADDWLLSYFFVLVDTDFLFLIYYGLYRENKAFYPNAAIWIISSIARGWNGIFIFILFFEFIRLHRAGLLNVKLLLLVALASAILYPVLSAAKWIIRANAFAGVDYGMVVSELFEAIQAENYFELVFDGIQHVISRLQTVSLLVEVIENASSLQDDLANFRFLPFWLEGIHGILFDRLFYGTERLPVGVVMTEYLAGFTDVEGIGNVNLSFAGWFFIAPMLTPFYLLYTAALGFFSMYFVKKIDNSRSASDLVWFVWIIYLMPPWLGAVFKFIYSAVLFLILKIAFANFTRTSVR